MANQKHNQLSLNLEKKPQRNRKRRKISSFGDTGGNNAERSSDFFARYGNIWEDTNKKKDRESFFVFFLNSLRVETADQSYGLSANVFHIQ